MTDRANVKIVYLAVNESDASELAGLGWADVTVITDPADFGAAFTGGYDIIMVGSGGDDERRDALFDLKAEFETFVNNGGGLFIHTDQGFGQSWYDFAPQFGTTQNNTIGDSGIFTVTPEGTAIGLTEGIVDADITHSFYTDLNPVFTIFELTDENDFDVPVGLPVAFGARGITIHDGQIGNCTTTVSVDEDDLEQLPLPGTSTYEGNNDVAQGDDLPAPSPVSVSGDLGVLYGADGPGELIGVQYTGPALTSQGKPVVLVEEGGVWYGRVLDNDPSTPGDQPRDVFKLEVDFASQTFTFTLLDNLDHPLTNDPSTPATETSFEDNLLLTFGVTVSDFDGDEITTTLTVNVDDDSPTIVDNEGEHAPAVVTLDESVGNDASNPGDTTQSNPPGDDTGNSAPTFPLPAAHVGSPIAFGSATIDGTTIAGLFSASPGADGEGSHEYTLTLKDDGGTPTGIGNAFVQTNLSITDFTATGDATPVYGDDTIYLFQVSAYQINGVVAGVDGDINSDADNQFAFWIVIDPITGAVTVEQYLAIHNPDAGNTPIAYDDLVNMRLGAWLIAASGQR